MNSTIATILPTLTCETKPPQWLFVPLLFQIALETFEGTFKSISLKVHDVFGLLPLLIAILMFIAHAFGINSVLHLLTGEIFPTRFW